MLTVIPRTQPIYDRVELNDKHQSIFFGHDRDQLITNLETAHQLKINFEITRILFINVTRKIVANSYFKLYIGCTEMLTLPLAFMKYNDITRMNDNVYFNLSEPITLEPKQNFLVEFNYKEIDITIDYIGCILEGTYYMPVA